MKNHKTVGKPVIRVDAESKVIGKAKYVDDITPEGCLHGVLLRSEKHHALLRSINFAKAEECPGIVRIITLKDVPGEKYLGPIIKDRPILADDRVRFVGEPIAVIIAKTRQEAEIARNAIEVDYEDLPTVFDPVLALDKSAPILHGDSNLCMKYHMGCGDVEKGIEKSDLVVKDTFSVPRAYQAYLEPEASVAQWDADGSLIVWVSSQKPFQDRAQISQTLNLPEEKIIVKSPYIGGAFGGKEDSSLATIVALGAYLTRRPLKITITREESMLAHPKRHAAIMKYEIGTDTKGHFNALRAEIFMDTGAYASYGPGVAGFLAEMAAGPYRIPNVEVIVHLVYTNGPIAGAFRGFGSPQPNFAYESLVDMVAEELKMESDCLREKNIWKTGDKAYTGVIVNQPGGLMQCLKRAKKERERLNQVKAGNGKISGVGVALSLHAMGLGFRLPDSSTNSVIFLPDGRVELYVGAPDLGQGLLTASAQIAAEVLQIPLEKVIVKELDTSICDDGGVTCASRMTYLVGNSVVLAAKNAIELLISKTAELLSIDSSELDYSEGRIRVSNDPRRTISVDDVVSKLAEEGESIKGVGKFTFPYDENTPENLPFGLPHVKFLFGAQVARIEVDPEIGEIDVKEIVAIHDVGKAINPNLIEGQIEGGVVMGLGYALMEDMVLKNDDNWVTGFSEYLVPTSLDAPDKIISVIVEEEEETGPFGAKGVAEGTLTPVAAAISNAVYDAVGYRPKSIPINPEDLSRVTM